MESSSSNPQAGTGDSLKTPAEAGNSTETSQTDDATGASMRRALEDADDVGRRTSDPKLSYLQDAKSQVSAAAHAGKVYAQDAVNAAGKKIEDMKGQAAELKQRGMQFAAEEPMKTVAFAAAAGALLTAVLLSSMRSRR